MIRKLKVIFNHVPLQNQHNVTLRVNTKSERALFDVTPT